MSFSLKYDVQDAYNIPGLLRPWDSDVPYLTPVFFNKEVLVRYFYDPRYICKFISETYGEFYNLNLIYDLPFGINSNGKVIAWLGDIEKLPDSEINYLASENIESDHNISSDFYDAQINIVYTNHIKEVEIILLKYKINSASYNKYGIYLFKENCRPKYDEIIEKCSRYKRLVFQNEDDLKRFLSEWNEYLVEDINHKSIKTFLDGHGKEYNKGIKNNKVLEVFIRTILKTDENIIAPFFYLYDLRIWSNHQRGNTIREDIVSSLGLEESVNNEAIYISLIDHIEIFLCKLLRLLQ